MVTVCAGQGQGLEANDDGRGRLLARRSKKCRLPGAQKKGKNDRPKMQLGKTKTRNKHGSTDGAECWKTLGGSYALKSGNKDLKFDTGGKGLS